MVHMRLLLRYWMVLLLLTGLISACGGGGNVPDGVPNSFSFTSENNAEPGTYVESSQVTIRGINVPVDISVTNGEYRINGGGYTTALGAVEDGQTVQVRTMSASTYSTETTATLTVAEQSADFSVTTHPQDTSPDAFSFGAQNEVALNTQITSSPQTISGIHGLVPISISGGEYAIADGAFTNQEGEVSTGQSVQVRLTSSSEIATETVATLTVGDVDGAFSVTTISQDTIPNAFSFAPVNEVTINTLVGSASATIEGITSTTSVAIENGEYSVNGARYTSAVGSIANGQNISVRMTSASTFASTVSATVTIGGVVGTFDVTTEAQDVVPDAFAFSDLLGIEPATLATSDSVTISGINDATAISVADGEYSIDGGAFTSLAGTVTNGQSVQVRGVSSPDLLGLVEVVLTVGGITDTYSITTFDDITPPVVEILFPPPVSMTEGSKVTVRGTATDDYSEIVSLQVNGEDVTDTSTDGSFATWSITVNITEGVNRLIVAVEDTESNFNLDADSVSVRRDILKGDFPNDNVLFSNPESFVNDLANNRLLVFERDTRNILAVDTLTGLRSLFFENSGDIVLGANVLDLLLDVDNDRLLFPDSDLRAIVAVDLTSTATSIVTSNDMGSGPNFTGPSFIEFNPLAENTLVVGDSDSVKFVNLNSHTRTEFSSNTLPNANNPFSLIYDIAHDQENTRFFVSDDAGVVFAVDENTGARTVFSSNSVPDASEPLFQSPNKMLVDIQRERLIVNDTLSSTLVSVDLDAGTRSVLSSPTVPNIVSAPDAPLDVIYHPEDEYLYWLNGDGSILAVDIESGDRVILSKGGGPD